MIEEFPERYGYDPSPYLPVFNGYGQQPDGIDRFLWT